MSFIRRCPLSEVLLYTDHSIARESVRFNLTTEEEGKRFQYQGISHVIL